MSLGLTVSPFPHYLPASSSHSSFLNVFPRSTFPSCLIQLYIAFCTYHHPAFPFTTRPLPALSLPASTLFRCGSLSCLSIFPSFLPSHLTYLSTAALGVVSEGCERLVLLEGPMWHRTVLAVLKADLSFFSGLGQDEAKLCRVRSRLD